MIPSDEYKSELGVLGNLMMILVLEAGGAVSINRDRWEEIRHMVLHREYDPETNCDVLEIVTNKGNKVLM